MSDTSRTEIIEFRIQALAPNVSEDEVRRLLDEAVAEAVAETEGVEEARAELRGAFAGVGETVVVVLLFLAKAAAAAVAGAAGKHFYEAALKPRLQKKNLLPSADAAVTERDAPK